MKRTYFFYLAALIMDMCAGAALLATPLLAIKLGASVAQLGLIGTVWAFFYTASCPLSGKLSDRFGRGQMLFYSCVLFALTYTAMASVGGVVHIFVLVAFSGVSAAMFWPSIEAWIAENKGPQALMTALGVFSVCWSIGLLLGPLVGGHLYEIDFRLPFYFVSASAIALGLVFLILPLEGTDVTEVNAEGEEDQSWRGYLYVAWIANFVTFFLTGIIRNIFPKLAVELGMDAGTLGILLASIALAQILVFALISVTGRWRHRMRPLILSQCLAGLGMILVYKARSPLIFAVAFMFLGLLIAISYHSSIFYSLFKQEKKGAKSGLHESILGSGFLFGPLVGGFVAERFGLRAPYLLCLGPLLVGISAEIYVLKAWRGVR